MNKKIIIGGLVVLVIIGGAAFYSGMVYVQDKMPARGQFGNGQFNAQFNGRPGARGDRTGGMGGFTAGEIISKDTSSITIKMQNGSTKIVLVSDSTQVTKTASSTLAELSNGTNVTVTGTANSDGSVTAESVQIRPAGAASFGGQPPMDQQTDSNP